MLTISFLSLYSSLRIPSTEFLGQPNFRSAAPFILPQLLLSFRSSFYPLMFFTMDVFKNMTLLEIGRRYEDDQACLVRDLMAAKLLCSDPPPCPFCGGVMAAFPTKPWWRCPVRTCSATVPRITKNCFLFGAKETLSEVGRAVLLGDGVPALADGEGEWPQRGHCAPAEQQMEGCIIRCGRGHETWWIW